MPSDVSEWSSPSLFGAWPSHPALQIAPSLIDSENSSFHQQRQPSHADGMGVMQIRHHRGVLPEFVPASMA
jgi:hypothetical protein